MNGKMEPYPRYSPDKVKLEWFTKNFPTHFETMVISPAKDLVEHRNGAMPAFLWITCAIDWLAGFMYGKERGKIKGDVRNSYVKFIETYFDSNTKYKDNAEGLYIFRNGLIHNYTIKVRNDNKKREYCLTHKRIDGNHFDVITNGQTLLNLDDFFADFVLAKNKYFNDVEKKQDCSENFIECYDREGFLQLY